mgnify:CR=1 FL=1
MAILEVNNLKKTYTSRFGSVQVHALTDVSFSVEEGEYVAIMGESGSGKTTLLNLLAALDRPTGGEVRLSGKALFFLNQPEQDMLGAHIGLVKAAGLVLRQHEHLARLVSELVE